MRDLKERNKAWFVTCLTLTRALLPAWFLDTVPLLIRRAWASPALVSVKTPPRSNNWDCFWRAKLKQCATWNDLATSSLLLLIHLILTCMHHIYTVAVPDTADGEGLHYNVSCIQDSILLEDWHVRIVYAHVTSHQRTWSIMDMIIMMMRSPAR